MHHDSHDQKNNSKGEVNENMTQDPMPENMTDREAMTLIPWEDIWTSLKLASHRGNGEMVAVFYETLFKEAVFDDNGAWAWDINKRN
jgi:hypothetical protein